MAEERSIAGEHIAGAIDVDFKNREKLLLRFPKQWIEIFTYCY